MCTDRRTDGQTVVCELHACKYPVGYPIPPWASLRGCSRVPKRCAYLLLSRKRVMTTCIVCSHLLVLVVTTFGGRPEVCQKRVPGVKQDIRYSSFTKSFATQTTRNRRDERRETRGEITASSFRCQTTSCTTGEVTRTGILFSQQNTLRVESEYFVRKPNSTRKSTRGRKGLSEPFSR